MDYSSASDVSTDGVLVEAVNACGAGAANNLLINGVPFMASTGLMSGDATTNFFFGETGDSNYNQLLNSLDYQSGSSASVNVAVGLLEVGKVYQIQLWYADERGASDGRAMQFGDGTSSPLSGEVNDQYVTGTFTATSASQTITINGVSSGPHFNAYQVRDVSSPIPVISTTAGETVTSGFVVSLGFSENITGLSAGDFSVTNGTASNLSGSGSNWSVSITPTSNGDVLVTLPKNKVIDGNGHGNAKSNTLLTTYVAPGSEQPVPTLSTSASSVDSDFTVQVGFSEDVTGLQASDFAVSGGTVSSVTGSGASYSVVVSPNFGGKVSLSLPRNTVLDTNDNLQNVDSNTVVVDYFVVASVSSPDELLPYLLQDNVTATLAPGSYTIDASDVTNTFGSPRFEFRGSNSTYDFTGVTINFAADIYTTGLGMNHLQVFGNDNVLLNLTMVDLCDKYGSAGKDGGVNVVVDGRNNRIEGFHMTIKGSYPYGYGDCFGKGGPYTIKHWKHSALLVRGESNHVKNCTLIHRSYGHAIFMQAASNPKIEGCYVEGEMRTTDDMLAETSGPAFDIDFLTVWGYALPAGYMKSTGEGGIRAYNAGQTVIDGVSYSRGTSNPVIIDNTVVNMRTGVTLTHASGTKYVSGCKTTGCERGYAIGSGIIENCSGDAQYGPLFGVDYESDSGVIADITVLPYEGPHYNGSRHFAYIYGSNHKLTFRGMESNPDQALEVNVGGDKRIESDIHTIDNLSANNIVINNLTGHPLILDGASSGVSGQSVGSVTNAGTGNNFTMRDWSVTENVTFHGRATQSSSAYGTIASLATDQNTSGNFSNGSVTHTSNEAQPWWQIDLKKSYDITEIRIWGRTVSSQSRLSNYDVTILNEVGQPVWTSYQADYPNPMVSLDSGSATGRYVKVQLRGTNPLSLAEVEVFGIPADPEEPHTELENWRFTHFETYLNIGDAADDYDADFDGIVNLLEYATGRDPKLAEPEPVLEVRQGVSEMEAVFNRIEDASLDYVLEGRSDLSADTWVPVWTGTGTAADTIVIPESLWPSHEECYFLRLGVSR